MPLTYEIHPAIGIARLGNSPDEFFVGPESPGIPAAPPGGFKDTAGRIKRQAARFRVYEFNRSDAGELISVREITSADASITWTVHLANRKAAAAGFLTGAPRNASVPTSERHTLVIDAGVHTIITGTARVAMAGSFRGSEVPLGHLDTDEAGRLLVLGGFGRSFGQPVAAQITDFADNDDWCDDASDGPVRAAVLMPGSNAGVEATPSWVIVGPPDFAPPIGNLVSLWDICLHVAAEIDPGIAPPDAPVSFSRDIYPILRRTVHMQWTSQRARQPHGAPNAGGNFLRAALFALLASNDIAPGSAALKARGDVFKKLRKPDGSGPGNMPALGGNEKPLALTPLQYARMERWARGDFQADWTGEPLTPPLDALPAAQQPAALDFAALDNANGGPFFPGIEVGAIIAERLTYEAPFRITRNLQPGLLTARNAVPWQADFLKCDEGWWPAQRPSFVKRGNQLRRWVPTSWNIQTDHRKMVDNWPQFGFVVQSGAEYIEDQRDPNLG